MQIKTLQLKDFLSHADTSIALEPLTVVRGANGVGKSAINQAIEYLLTGRCSSTGDNGQGAKDLIRKDSDRMSVTAEILDPDLRKMRATLSEKSPRAVVFKKESDPTWKGDDYLAYLALNRDVLSCLLNGRYFIEMPESRQKELLAGIVLPESYEWPKEIVDLWHSDTALQQIGGVVANLNWAGKPFDLIAKAYDVAYEARKIVNRAIKDWREPETVPVTAQSAEEIRPRLKQRQDERTAVAVERQQIIDRRSEALKHQEKAAQRIARINAKLAEERGTKLSVKERILSKDRLKDAMATAAHSAEAGRLDGVIQGHGDRLTALKLQRQAYLELLNDPKCPTCAQPITPDGLESIMGPLNRDIDASKVEYDSALKARKELGDVIGAQKMIAEHTQAESDMRLVEAKLVELASELAAEQAQESIPEADTSGQDQKLADLDLRIQKGNEALTAAIQHETRKADYAREIARKKALDEQLARMERLVEYFGPKGIQAELLDKHVGYFQAAMNKVLQKWGYYCRLAFDPYEFTVCFTEAKQAFPTRTLSASQRYRFACAFQIALASATGIRLAVIDAADILDTSGRQSLFGALREAIGSDIDQAIVMATDERRDAPKALGVAFYMLSLDKSGDVPTTVVERLS